MEITSVKIYPVGKKQSFVGFADVTFDDCFVVRNLRVIRTQSGRIIALSPERPQTKRDKKLDRRVAYYNPVKKEMREKLEAALKEAVDALPAPSVDPDAEPAVKSEE